jgi:hypothetical protein
MRRRLLALTLLASAAGCDWLSGTPPISFPLPERSFVLATTNSQWQTPPGAFAMPVECSGREDCCMPPGGPPLSCTQFPFVCATGTCAIEFPLELVVAIDLGHDAAELTQVRGQVPAEVTLDSFGYTVASALNVALPQVTLYVGPSAAASASSPEAHRLGVIPLTNAGFRGGGVIGLDADAQRAFGMYARDLQTPFHLIASTTISVRSGSPVPSGEVDLTVTGRVTVRF